MKSLFSCDQEQDQITQKGKREEGEQDSTGFREVCVSTVNPWYEFKLFRKLRSQKNRTPTLKYPYEIRESRGSFNNPQSRKYHITYFLWNVNLNTDKEQINIRKTIIEDRKRGSYNEIKASKIWYTNDGHKITDKQINQSMQKYRRKPI